MAFKRRETAEFWDFTSSSDLTLVVENKELHVHRQILCSCSPVFKAMLESDFMEKCLSIIPLPDKKAREVQEMLNFIYPFGHQITGILMLIHVFI